MSARPRLRTVVAAVAAVLAVTAGPAVLTTAVATAAPGESEFPFDENAPGRGSEPKTDERAERAEKFGGGLAGELIDLGGNVLKCGLSIATKTVTCPL